MVDDQTSGSLPWWPSLDARRAAQAERRRARRQARGAQRQGRSRERTTAEEIVATAVRIIDADGLDALTVRRLASELGVAAMTVYSYVRSKDELLDLVVDGVAGDVALPPGEGDWRERAEALAHSLRTALLTHPEGARLISERPIQSPNAFRIFDAGLGIFRDAGFPDELAADAYFAFGNYVMGSVAQDTAGIRLAPRSASGEAPTGGPAPAYIEQLPADQFPNIRALAPLIYGPSERAAEPDPGSQAEASSRRFDFGLDSLLDGLAQRLHR
jgi:AcrR family transcriptional regulator